MNNRNTRKKNRGLVDVEDIGNVGKRRGYLRFVNSRPRSTKKVNDLNKVINIDENKVIKIQNNKEILDSISFVINFLNNKKDYIITSGDFNFKKIKIVKEKEDKNKILNVINILEKFIKNPDKTKDEKTIKMKSVIDELTQKLIQIQSNKNSTQIKRTNRNLFNNILPVIKETNTKTNN